MRAGTCCDSWGREGRRGEKEKLRGASLDRAEGYSFFRGWKKRRKESDGSIWGYQFLRPTYPDSAWMLSWLLPSPPPPLLSSQRAIFEKSDVGKHKGEKQGENRKKRKIRDRERDQSEKRRSKFSFFFSCETEHRSFFPVKPNDSFALYPHFFMPPSHGMGVCAASVASGCMKQGRYTPTPTLSHTRQKEKHNIPLTSPKKKESHKNGRGKVSIFFSLSLVCLTLILPHFSPRPSILVKEHAGKKKRNFREKYSCCLSRKC